MVESIPWNAKPGPLVATCLMSIPLSQLINPRKAKTAKPAKKLKNNILRSGIIRTARGSLTCYTCVIWVTARPKEWILRNMEMVQVHIISITW